MANPFYDAGEQRAAKVNRLFARIATRYDLLNDLQSLGWHRIWKRRLVRLAQPQAGQQALDVCCGTGDLALALARCGVITTGIDFSEEMLAVARRRVASRCGAERVAKPPQLTRGDAQHLPFRDHSFDMVTVGYGLRNLADWQAGLREMMRVARPGGRVLVLDFGKPPNRLWRCMFFGYLKTVVPLMGLLFCGDARAYAYILESLKHYPAQEGVAAEMRALGMQDVRVVSFLGGVMSINHAVKSAASSRWPAFVPRLQDSTTPIIPSVFSRLKPRNSFKQRRRRATGNYGNNHQLATEPFNGPAFLLVDGIERVIPTLHVDIRLGLLQESSGAHLVEETNTADTFQCGEHSGTIGFAVHRPARSLQTAHRRIAVQPDQ